MNRFTSLDGIAPRIRASVTKVKYGSMTYEQLARLLEGEASWIREHATTIANLKAQGMIDDTQ